MLSALIGAAVGFAGAFAFMFVAFAGLEVAVVIIYAVAGATGLVAG
jgi:hypothetical protein